MKECNHINNLRYLTVGGPPELKMKLSLQTTIMSARHLREKVLGQELVVVYYLEEYTERLDVFIMSSKITTLYDMQWIFHSQKSRLLQFLSCLCIYQPNTKLGFFLYIIKDVNYLHFLYVNHIFKIIAVPNVFIYLLTIPDALDYFSLSYRIILHQTCCET